MSDAARRRFVAGVAALALAGRALAAGRVERGVHWVRGDARIDGVRAQRGMAVRSGQLVTTGPGAELVFVVERDAFLVRGDSRVELAGAEARALVTVLRIASGAVLSVFSSGVPRRVETPTATVGIRGSGLYVEIEPARTYVCLCYGEAELAVRDDPQLREIVRTTYHESPRWIAARGAARPIAEAPVQNHSDAELILLENLVGRSPPFAEHPQYRPGTY